MCAWLRERRPSGQGHSSHAAARNAHGPNSRISKVSEPESSDKKIRDKNRPDFFACHVFVFTSEHKKAALHARLPKQAASRVRLISSSLARRAENAGDDSQGQQAASAVFS